MSRLLHTGDWHLGAPLAGEPRPDHFQAMLDGMVSLIKAKEVTCLLVAGDLFDSPNPPVYAERMYFTFLDQLQETSCRDVVIISGNHDSPRLLAAPATPLRRLGVHIVTDTEPDHALVPVGDDVVILAVPYLRDGSLGTLGGDSEEERSACFTTQVKEYLSELSREASRRYPARKQVVMAHEFMVGSAMDNGKKEIDYVGSLSAIPSSVFPRGVSYVALGHIHRPQQVKGAMPIRYAGSPLAIDFGEAGQTKQVVLVDTDPWKIQQEDLPVFANMRQVKGDLAELKESLRSLVEDKTPVWVAAAYTGDRPVPELRRELFAITENSEVRLMQVIDMQAWHRPSSHHETVDLGTLTPKQVFLRRLESERLDDETRGMLIARFEEIVRQIGGQT